MSHNDEQHVSSANLFLSEEAVAAIMRRFFQSDATVIRSTSSSSSHTTDLDMKMADLGTSSSSNNSGSSGNDTESLPPLASTSASPVRVATIHLHLAIKELIKRSVRHHELQRERIRKAQGEQAQNTSVENEAFLDIDSLHAVLGGLLLDYT